LDDLTANNGGTGSTNSVFVVLQWRRLLRFESGAPCCCDVFLVCLMLDLLTYSLTVERNETDRKKKQRMEGDPLFDAPVFGPIPVMRYCRNFLSDAQQASLTDKIITSKTWVQLKNRKLQQWGGTPEEKVCI
jgi:hypothetical protein